MSPEIPEVRRVIPSVDSYNADHRSEQFEARATVVERNYKRTNAPYFERFKRGRPALASRPTVVGEPSNKPNPQQAMENPGAPLARSKTKRT